MHEWLHDSQRYFDEPISSDGYFKPTVDLEMGALKNIIIDIESSLTDPNPISNDNIFDLSAEALREALIDIESSLYEKKSVDNVSSPEKNPPSLSLGTPLVVAPQNSNTTPSRFTRFRQRDFPQPRSPPKKFSIFGRRLFSSE